MERGIGDTIFDDRRLNSIDTTHISHKWGDGLVKVVNGSVVGNDRFLRSVRKSWDHLHDNVSMKEVDDALKNRLLMQSILGHARNGHVGFLEKDERDIMGDVTAHRKYMYPNVSVKDICLALNYDPQDVMDWTQKVIDDNITYTLQDLIQAEKKNREIDAEDKVRENTKDVFSKHPVRKNFYEQFNLDNNKHIGRDTIKQFLVGKYLGSTMDDHERREEAEKLYNQEFDESFTFHKGEVVIGNLEKMTSSLTNDVLTLADFANGDYKEKLRVQGGWRNVERFLKREGYVSKERIRKADDQYQPVFVRYEDGSGTSDDLALITAGVLRGCAAFLGVEDMDFIDTMEKFTAQIANGGTDKRFGEMIKKEYENELNEPSPISDKEISTHILLSARDIYPFNTDDFVSSYPSSSQRYLWQDEEFDNIVTRAVNTHMRFIYSLNGYGGQVNNTSLGFSRTRYDDFIQGTKMRLERFEKKGLIGKVEKEDMKKSPLQPLYTTYL